MTRPRLPDLRSPAVAMVAVLLTWLAAWAIEAAAGLHLDVIVLAVVLALSLGRSAAGAGAAGHGLHVVVRLVLLPLVAVLATQVGRLLATHHWIGGLVFCGALALPVWVRRFGRAWSLAGTLVTLPFIALLVVPVPVPIDRGTAHTLWPALFAVVAFVIVSIVYAVAGRLGLLGEPTPLPAPPPAATAARARGRLPASTRMAVQLLLGLLASYALGEWLFPTHWPWLVLSCFVVCSGNRGRGDVLHKGVLRLIGALAGTASATLLAGAFAAGDRIAIGLIFVVLAVALWLREASYAWWAAGVTAILALLHGYVGIDGGAGGVGRELGDRLIGVLLGSLVAVAVSWWVLPVRSTDVLRKRLGEALRSFRDDDLAGFRVAVAQLEQIAPAHRMHRTVLRAHHDDHPATVVERLVAIRDDWTAASRRDREMGAEIRAMADVLRKMGQK